MQTRVEARPRNHREFASVLRATGNQGTVRSGGAGGRNTFKFVFEKVPLSNESMDGKGSTVATERSVHEFVTVQGGR